MLNAEVLQARRIKIESTLVASRASKRCNFFCCFHLIKFPFRVQFINREIMMTNERFAFSSSLEHHRLNCILILIVSFLRKLEM